MDETESNEQSPDEVFLTAVLFEGALGVLALVLGWAIGPSARATIPEFVSEQWWQIASGLLYGSLAAIPILLFIEFVRRIPCEPVRELERLTDDEMIGSLLALRPSELIVISICAGIGEELLFRGWLMYWLAEGGAMATGSTASPLALGRGGGCFIDRVRTLSSDHQVVCRARDADGNLLRRLGDLHRKFARADRRPRDLRRGSIDHDRPQRTEKNSVIAKRGSVVPTDMLLPS